MVILSVFQPPESPVIYEQRNTRAVLDNRDLGLGTVYVSERMLCWKEQGEAGFCIEHPHISMHATTTDPSVYPTECILIMVDTQISMPGGIVGSNENQRIDDENDTDSEPDASQLILVPPDSNSIRSIYNALNHCQTLNPDPEDVDDEEEENVYEDAEEFVSNGRVSDLAAGGDSEMNHLSAQLNNHSIHTSYSYGNGDQNFDDDQFEDAD